MTKSVNVVDVVEFWKWVETRPELAGFRRRHERAMSQTIQDYNWQASIIDKEIAKIPMPKAGFKVEERLEEYKSQVHDVLTTNSKAMKAVTKATNILNTPHGKMIRLYNKSTDDIWKAHEDRRKGEKE